MDVKLPPLGRPQHFPFSDNFSSITTSCGTMDVKLPPLGRPQHFVGDNVPEMLAASELFSIIKLVLFTEKLSKDSLCWKLWSVLIGCSSIHSPVIIIVPDPFLESSDNLVEKSETKGEDVPKWADKAALKGEIAFAWKINVKKKADRQF
jgi:hypothetical protein